MLKHKRLVAVVTLGLLFVFPLGLMAAWQDTTNNLFSGHVTVTGANKTIFTTKSPPPSGARQIPAGLRGSLTVVWESGDALYCNPNPNTTAAVAATTQNDQLWVDSAHPVFEMGIFNPQNLQCISAGTTVMYYAVLVSK